MLRLAKNRAGISAYHIAMALFGILMIYPLLWMLSSSLKPSTDIMITTGQLIPRELTLENYAYGWKGFGGMPFAAFFKNSIFVAAVRVAGTVFSCSVIAFGFARIPFRTRRFWFMAMILTMCLPGQILQIPQYILFNRLGWVGTYLPLLVPSFFGGAFNVFLLVQFMKGIPLELDESAKIDGCGWIRLFALIIAPLVRPAMATVAVLTFMASWDDFYSALIYLNKPSLYPVAYALKLYSSEVSTNYGPMLAMSVLSLLPVLLLFFAFQKSLVEGIGTVGIKG
ncbi:MAG: carbohydrate ABC transporter permease [Clostridiales bacterium]|jgi:multiple sugar transport system permease protein|nr:carbohydrate ABC transporter permease [Clostridiales bacterium]